jgi:ribosomal-protein-alanine N-acetyltransferase
MKIRTLQVEDTAALLAFELHNREWFEQYVLPRSDSVYSYDGMSAHVDTCMRDHAIGTMHPCIILDANGRIAGRANLKDIDAQAGTSEIGYRIGQEYVGKGVATEALKYMMALAYEEWCLARLFARVSTENPASARVLEKCGFVRGELSPEISKLKAKVISCYEYEHRSSRDNLERLTKW